MPTKHDTIQLKVENCSEITIIPDTHPKQTGSRKS